MRGYERSDVDGGLCTACRTGFRRSAVACVECESNATSIICIILMCVRRSGVRQAKGRVDHCFPRCFLRAFVVSGRSVGVGPAAQVVIPAVVCGLYQASRSELAARQTTLFGAALAIGSTVTWAQVLAGLSMLDLPWPEDFQAILKFASLFLFDVDVLQFECLFGFGHVAKYLLSVLGPAVLILGYFALYGVSKVLPGEYQMQWSPTVNAAGTVSQIVFIELISIAMTPWQRLTQPTGADSVFKYPSVDFGTSDHNTMVALGMLALLGIAMPYLVWSMVVIRDAPERAVADPSFLRTYRFIFAKYRNECYTFHLYFLLRQFLIALVPMVSPTETPEAPACGQRRGGAKRAAFCGSPPFQAAGSP